MSETNVDDIFDLDFDHDVLIQLLGKLSLDNIPSDVSETLLSIENRTDETMSKVNSQPDIILPYIPEELNSSTSNSAEVNISANKELEKEHFLSSIGLVSGVRKATKDSESKADESLKQHCVSSLYPSSLINLSLDDTHNNKKIFTPLNYSLETNAQGNHDLQELFNNNTCDSTKFDEHAHSSYDQSNDALILKLHELFSCQQGRVYDIRLNNLDDSTKSGQSVLPFLSEDEFLRDNRVQSPCENPSSSIPTGSDFLYVDKTSDSNDKPVRSPDSGYDTSSCSSAISPCSPPISSESSYTIDIFADTSNDELDSLVAAIVDIENTLMCTDISQNSCNIPILRNAKDPEDHKESILNFLKEPIYDKHSFSEPSENKDENSSSSFELAVPKNVSLIDSRVPLPHVSTSRKSPIKSKELKSGYEVKYAARNELQHSSLFHKVKHCEKNKILKQIQEDERAMRRIKVIQLLDKKLKLKRSAIDDRENKRRRVQCRDSC